MYTVCSLYIWQVYCMTTVCIICVLYACYFSSIFCYLLLIDIYCYLVFNSAGQYTSTDLSISVLVQMTICLLKPWIPEPVSQPYSMSPKFYLRNMCLCHWRNDGMTPLPHKPPKLAPEGRASSNKFFTTFRVSLKHTWLDCGQSKAVKETVDYGHPCGRSGSARW